MRTGVAGSLDACFSARGLASVSARGALELRGPLPGAGGCARYFLRNVTAGILGGDDYSVRLQAEPGSRVQIASSSATKVLDMPAAGACSSAFMLVEAGGRLTWGPHVSILQRGAMLRQSTTIHLSQGASAIVAEVVVMGRLAREERFDFRSYEAELSVRGCGRELYREHYEIVPGADLSSAMAGCGALASVYALSLEPDPGLGEGLEAMTSRAELAGWSSLPNGCGFVAKSLHHSLSSGQAFVEACLRSLM